MLERITALEEKIAKQEKEIEEIRTAIAKINANMLLPKHLVQADKTNEFDSLKMLLNSDQWPHAIDPTLICNAENEQDKEDRAEGIIDLVVDVHLKNLSFLDFGCGDGHVVEKTRQQGPRRAVGFDIKTYEKWDEWESSETIFHTNDWEEVQRAGPYNAILMYDVIDHIIGHENEVINALKRIKSVAAPGVKVFVRCHPWCSRHATHLYHKMNKAYLHVIFTSEELEKMGLITENEARKIIHPIITYQNWFRQAGFQVPKQPNITSENIENFFVDTPVVARRIKSHWAASHDHKLRTGQTFPTIQLQQQFLDFVLT